MTPDVFEAIALICAVVVAGGLASYLIGGLLEDR